MRSSLLFFELLVALLTPCQPTVHSSRCYSSSLPSTIAFRCCVIGDDVNFWIRSHNIICGDFAEFELTTWIKANRVAASKSASWSDDRACPKPLPVTTNQFRDLGKMLRRISAARCQFNLVACAREQNRKGRNQHRLWISHKGSVNQKNDYDICMCVVIFTWSSLHCLVYVIHAMFPQKDCVLTNLSWMAGCFFAKSCSELHSQTSIQDGLL